MTDLLLHPTTDDLLIKEGDFVLGQSLAQETAVILRMSPGELKEDPVLGPGLIQLIHGNAPAVELRHRIRKHLQRDQKDYDHIKTQIQLKP